MIDLNNKYTKMQKKFYDEDQAKEMAKVNHRHHDNNSDYWHILLEPIIKNKEHWKGKKALDFGCGTGRNIQNLLAIARWERVDGVDISEANIKQAEKKINRLSLKKFFKLYVNNGIDLDILPENEYNFIMSTITLQHIAVYDIRLNLLKGMFRAMQSGGVLSIQMGYGDNGYGKAEYYANDYNAKSTNSEHDVIVVDSLQIENDLDDIGFEDISYEIRDSFSDGHPNWIFFKAIKP